MEQSRTNVQSTDDRSLLLIQHLMTEQKQSLEGSSEWLDYQSKINQIAAERFLQYLNR